MTAAPMLVVTQGSKAKPPHSDDAEQAVLSAMFMDGEAVASASQLLDQSMFHDDGNRQIFAIMVALAGRGIVVDPITVFDEMETTGLLEVCGGRDYIGYLQDVVPTATNVEYHAKIVREKARLRTVNQINARASQQIGDGVSVGDVIREQQLALSAIETQLESRRPFRFLDDEGLDGLSDPSWLVDGLLPDKGLLEIHGQSGHGKGFFVLDLGLSIQTGIPFHGRRVRRGQFVYVSVEGSSGLKIRRRAWVNARGVTGPTGALFLTTPVALMDATQVRAFIAELKMTTTSPIALVVFDTLAKCMVGGDENSSKDMGLVISGMEQVQREFDCLVGIVHHTGKNGAAGPRGSSALHGAADAEYAVKKDGLSLTVECTKMKDDDDSLSLAFDLETEPRSGSLVITTKLEWESSGPVASTEERRLLELLSRSFPGESPSTSKWLEASELKPATFYRHRGDLVTKGYVTSEKHGKSVYNTLTAKGNELIAINSQTTIKSLSESNAQSLSSCPPSLEGACGESNSGFLSRDEEEAYFASQENAA